MDMISSLPLTIIETILCFLPIQEAARTSILKKEWRYHWIGIPKLTFIQDTYQVLTDSNEIEVSAMEQRYERPSHRKYMTTRCKLFYAIFQVMSIHEGPIIDFPLSVNADNSCVEIDHILSHLSRKNSNILKKLKLDMIWRYDLPLSFFSFRQLTDLYLNCCEFKYQPTFNGFRNLTSLYVGELRTTTKMLLHILSGSRLLKSVTLRSDSSTIELNDESTLCNLFECLPVIEKLTVWIYIVECFIEDRVPKKLTTRLVHLRYMCIEYISFIQRYSFPFLVLLIKNSPNLQKLKLEFCPDSWLEEYEIRYFALKDYSDIWLEHLNELELINFANRENELEFAKLMLVKAPVLKKVIILLDDKVDKDEELEISGILLQSPHTSPLVQIIVGKLETN